MNTTPSQYAASVLATQKSSGDGRTWWDNLKSGAASLFTNPHTEVIPGLNAGGNIGLKLFDKTSAAADVAVSAGKQAFTGVAQGVSKATTILLLIIGIVIFIQIRPFITSSKG